VNIIIDHPWDVVFPQAKALGKTTPLEWTMAVSILNILTSRTRFRSWSFYRYRKRFGDLVHCSTWWSLKTDHRWNREIKEFRICWLKCYTWFSIEKRYWRKIIHVYITR
jgi:hypothetical protein